MAPGLQRTFAAEAWPNIPRRYWQKAREEALDLVCRDTGLQIMGYDIDDRAVRLARHHARRAGVEEHIHFQRQPVSELSSARKYGCIICNPPYGERLGEKKEAEQIYREMGKVFKRLDTWSFYILTACERFEKLFGRRAGKKHKLYNGRIKVDLYQYFAPRKRGQATF